MGTQEWTGGRVMELTITKLECSPQGKWISNTLYINQTGASACDRCTERQRLSYRAGVGGFRGCLLAGWWMWWRFVFVCFWGLYTRAKSLFLTPDFMIYFLKYIKSKITRDTGRDAVGKWFKMLAVAVFYSCWLLPLSCCLWCWINELCSCY